jgi:hypothetical protein
MRQVLTGGKAFYGFHLGIILMDNQCARPVGDVGHAATFDFPVLYEVAENAPIRRVVENGADGLLPALVAAARHLESCGVRAIGTSCGFSSVYQEELADAVNVPVATSSLLQIPVVLRQLRATARVGLVTANARTLSDRHLAASGVSVADRERLTLVGLEETQAFYPSIVGGRLELDTAAVEAELVAACHLALERDPDIAAWIFECTNLPPYRKAVRTSTNLPVYDAVTLLTWLHRSTQP